MKKLIGKIITAGIEYKVYSCSDDIMDSCFGKTFTATQEIWLGPMTKTMFQDTLYHEALHALWHSSGLHQLVQNSGTMTPHNFQELFIRIITPHLIPTLDQVRSIKQPK